MHQSDPGIDVDFINLENDWTQNQLCSLLWGLLKIQDTEKGARLNKPRLTDLSSKLSLYFFIAFSDVSLCIFYVY